MPAVPTSARPGSARPSRSARPRAVSTTGQQAVPPLGGGTVDVHADRRPAGTGTLRPKLERVLVAAGGSDTEPRLRRAQAGDEGGRGLFPVAQLSARWGSRYHHTGKTIWAEHPTGTTPEPDLADLTAAAVWENSVL